MGPTFYRLVETNPPTRTDFLSQEMLGRVCNSRKPRIRDLWRGVSVYKTEADVRAHARLSPMLGRYIAVIQLPADGSIRFEFDTRPRGHCTIWATPEVILTLVVDVLEV